MAREELATLEAASRRAGRGAARAAGAARPERRAQRDPGGPRRHRRRRGRPVRRRPVPDVRPLRRAAALEVELISTSARAPAAASRRRSPRSRGDGAYSRLKFESGVHRVQRVPVTEAQGRIHTSTATVSVLPEADEVEIQIPDKDLRIDVYRSSGPGRPERQHHRQRGAHHAPADRPGGGHPGREEPAQEQGQGAWPSCGRACSSWSRRQAEERGDQRRSQVGTRRALREDPDLQLPR